VSARSVQSVLDEADRAGGPRSGPACQARSPAGHGDAEVAAKVRCEPMASGAEVTVASGEQGVCEGVAVRGVDVAEMVEEMVPVHALTITVVRRAPGPKHKEKTDTKVA
jgi:hypothetical protein